METLDLVILGGGLGWLALSVLVGCWAARKGFGTFRGFALSLAVSPLVAAIGIHVWDRERAEDR